MTKRSEEDKVFINHSRTALFWITESMHFLLSPNPRPGGLRDASFYFSDKFAFENSRSSDEFAYMKPAQQASLGVLIGVWDATG